MAIDSLTLNFPYDKDKKIGLSPLKDTEYPNEEQQEILDTNE